MNGMNTSDFPGKCCPLCDSINLSQTEDGKARCNNCGLEINPASLFVADKEHCPELREPRIKRIEKPNIEGSPADAVKEEPPISEEDARLLLINGIYVWYRLYAKGRDVENAFYIKDDNYPDAETPPRYRQDLTERTTISFKKSGDSFYKQRIEPRYRREYDEYVQREKSKFFDEALRTKKFQEPYEKHIKSLSAGKPLNGFLVVLGAILVLAGIGVMIWTFTLGMGFVGPLGLSPVIILGVILLFVNAPALKSSPEQKITYKEWLKRELDRLYTAPSFESYIGDKRAKYDARLQTSAGLFRDYASRLRNIKTRIGLTHRLPTECSSEYGVNCLLYLFLTGQADNLARAEQLYETYYIQAELSLDTAALRALVREHEAEIAKISSDGKPSSFRAALERDKTLLSAIDELIINKSYAVVSAYM